MQEFVEIPNGVKLKRLANLMEERAYNEDAKEAKKNEFVKMLRTMPADLVRREIS